MGIFENPWFWVVFFVNQGYCAILGYKIAEEYRANGAVGAALGLFFGVWGVPFALFVEDKRPKCTACGGRAKDYAIRCPNCGQENTLSGTAGTPATSGGLYG